MKKEKEKSPYVTNEAKDVSPKKKPVTNAPKADVVTGKDLRVGK